MNIMIESLHDVFNTKGLKLTKRIVNERLSLRDSNSCYVSKMTESMHQYYCYDSQQKP